MTNGNGNGARQTTVLIICITVLTCFAFTGSTIAFIARPDTAGTLVAILLAALGTTSATLANMVQVRGVREQVTKVESHTEELADGLLGAKVRSGVADVLRPELIDPAQKEQLVEDRETVAVSEAEHKKDERGGST